MFLLHWFYPRADMSPNRLPFLVVLSARRGVRGGVMTAVAVVGGWRQQVVVVEMHDGARLGSVWLQVYWKAIVNSAW